MLLLIGLCVVVFVVCECVFAVKIQPNGIVGSLLETHLEEVLLLKAEDVVVEQRVVAGKTSTLLSFPFQGIALEFSLTPSVHMFGRGVKVYGISQHNGARLVDHNFNIMWKDGDGNQFRVEDDVVIGGRFMFEGEKFALQRLDTHYSWGDMNMEEKNLFENDEELFNTIATQYYFAYHSSHMKFPHNLAPPKGQQNTSANTSSSSSSSSGSAFSECGSESLKQRAYVLSDTSPTDEPVLSRSARALLDDQETACFVSLVGDYKFFASKGSNFATAVNDIVEYISYVDANFRGTEFGTYQPVGLAIHSIFVFEDSASDPYYQASTWTVGDLLDEFSKRPDAPMDWSDVCLAHLFTHQDFDGGVQGLAWVANSANSGICDGYGVSKSTYLNTGLTTGINWGSNLLKLSLELTVQHELGHNFGSPHDPSQCIPEDNHYVMHATSVDGSKSNNALFSSCSRSSITSILATKATCFASPPVGICGNGILEPKGADGQTGTSDDEECDEGYSGGTCCDSTCKLKSGSVCSDENHECCENCGGIDGKLCYQSFATDYRCRASSYCTASSFDCPTPQQKPMGSLCVDGGVCLENSDESERCRSYCELFGASQCTCSDASDECAICCENNMNVTTLFCGDGFVWSGNVSMCVNETNSSIQVAGTRPFSSTCQAAYLVLTGTGFEHVRSVSDEAVSKVSLSLTPGTVCSIGVCTDSGVCREPNDDFASKLFSFFGDFSLSDASVLLKRFLIPSVMIISFILFIPIYLWINQKDQVRREILKRKASAIEKMRKKSTDQRGMRRRRSSYRRTAGGYRIKEDAQVYTNVNLSQVAPESYSPSTPNVYPPTSKLDCWNR
eukprot:m.25223 g.25223  ORF g.25223 m.25223 type:complete len:845 (-) comp9184_c0_seq1:163-2697(-)